MPFISCEVCDYQGRGKTPLACLRDVIEHESREHPRYHGNSEAEFDMLQEQAEEDAKVEIDDKRR